MVILQLCKIRPYVLLTTLSFSIRAKANNFLPSYITVVPYIGPFSNRDVKKSIHICEVIAIWDYGLSRIDWREFTKETQSWLAIATQRLSPATDTTASERVLHVQLSVSARWRDITITSTTKVIVRQVVDWVEVTYPYGSRQMWGINHFCIHACEISRNSCNICKKNQFHARLSTSSSFQITQPCSNWQLVWIHRHIQANPGRDQA